MARLAAAIRGVLALLSVPVAVIGFAPPVQPAWLAGALFITLIWTSIYVYVAWTRGRLLPWVIGVDVLMAIALCLATDRLVAAGAVVAISSWVATIASLTAICAQFAGHPIYSVPAGLVIAAAYVAGSIIAGGTDNGMAGAAQLVLQTVISAVAIAWGGRTARVARAALARYHESVQVAHVRLAQRAADRRQLSNLHNGPLTTLTMAGLGDLGDRVTTVRRRAAADMTALALLAAGVAQPDETAPEQDIRLDDRLRQVIAGYQPPLTVRIALDRCVLPEPVGEGFAEGVGEALENVVRHAGVTTVTVTLRETGGIVTVTVQDEGGGFDLASVPSYRFGLRHGVGALLTEAGGAVRIQSKPRSGTQVTMEWPRG